MNKKYKNILPTVEEVLESVTELFTTEETKTTEATVKTTNTLEEVFEVIGKENDLSLSLYQWYRYSQAFHNIKFKQVVYDPNEWTLQNGSKAENNGKQQIDVYIKKNNCSHTKHIAIVELVEHGLTFAVEGVSKEAVTSALFQEIPYPLTVHIDVYRNLFNNFITLKNRTNGESYTTVMQLKDISIEELSTEYTHIFPNVNIDEGEYEDLLNLAAYINYFYSSSHIFQIFNTSVKRAIETVLTMYNYDKFHEILHSIYSLTDVENEKTLVTLLDEVRFFLDDLPFDEEVSEFAEVLFEEFKETFVTERKEIENEYSGCYIEVNNITGEILNTPLTLQSEDENLKTVKEFEICHVCNGVHYYNRMLGISIQENSECSYCKN